MNKGFQVGLAAAKASRLIIGVILLVLAGHTFNAGAQTVTILHSFGSSQHDGQNPYAGLVQGSDGNFYGTTRNGGTVTADASPGGTVFRISPGGSYSNLHIFVGSPADGQAPWDALVQGSDGNLYGTTALGGTNGVESGGDGTVFRISPSGSETVLYSFAGYPTDAGTPVTGLVQGSDGNFYGTGGGGSVGYGSVFRIRPSGIEMNLHFFSCCDSNGYSPSGLVQGSDGNLYGTTCCTMFQISPSGTFTTLYSFGSQPNDGNDPNGLVQASDGNFYGTTHQSGANGEGTVFRISPSGTETTLYSFVGSPSDGANPDAGLVQGSDGNFYGTTYAGGTNNNGTAFRISPSGTETILYSFVGYPTDGANPQGVLVQGSDGNFYGTTVNGGPNGTPGYGAGTVFKVTVPPNPVSLNPPPYPINQITNVQVAAQDIIFGIPSIAGETYQLQFTTDLTSGNWVNEGGTITSIGALLTLTNFGGAVGPQGFYRFDITP